MKALSLWQPWATAIACGAKIHETRSWGTDYRGPIAIHAAKRCVIYEMIGVASSWTWSAALFDHFGRSMMGMGSQAVIDGLPFGAVVCIADLVSCRETGSLTQAEIDAERRPRDPAASPIHVWRERQMGDFSLGRYAWRFENVRPLSAPLLVRGRQGLWSLAPEEDRAVASRVRGKFEVVHGR